MRIHGLFPDRLHCLHPSPLLRGWTSRLYCIPRRRVCPLRRCVEVKQGLSACWLQDSSHKDRGIGMSCSYSLIPHSDVLQLPLHYYHEGPSVSASRSPLGNVSSMTRASIGVRGNVQIRSVFSVPNYPPFDHSSSRCYQNRCHPA